MKSLGNFWSLMRRIYHRKIKPKLPGYLDRLEAAGEKFTVNYSDQGNADLVIWPCREDNIKIVPVTDRSYEYAFTVEKFCEYNIKNQKILDVGSSGSVLPGILTALGNQVVCLDVREWPIQLPHLTVLKRDIINLNNENIGEFDVITCISTLEHFGLGRYGDKEDVEGDFKGMFELKKFLKSGGLMVLTLVFGKPTVVFPAHRVYNNSRLMRLIEGFKLLDRRFFRPISTQPVIYAPCSKEDTYQVDLTTGYYAIICLLLQKEKR